MQPTRDLFQATADLLAADAGTLAPAALANHLHLAINNFVPSLDLALGDLTEATFTGSAALSAGIGTQPTYYDVIDGLYTIRIEEPALGWNWLCTVDPAAPETVYGVYLTDNADAVLLGAMLLPDPVTIDSAGQGMGVGDVTFKFDPTSPH